MPSVTVPKTMRGAVGLTGVLFVFAPAVFAASSQDGLTFHGAPKPLAARAVTSLLAFLELMNGLIGEARTATAEELMASVLKQTNYRQYLLADFEEDGEERWENVQQLLALAAEYEGLAPEAALPQLAEPLYQRFCQLLVDEGVSVEQGIFQAEMAVSLVNDGPVTLWLDTAELMG